MPQAKQTGASIRKARYAMGYEDAVQRGDKMTDLELTMAASRAAYMVERNYSAGKRLSAANYEGKVAGFRHVLQQRRAIGNT